MKKNKLQKYNLQYFIERDRLQAHIFIALNDILRKRNAKKVLEVGVGSGKMYKKMKESGYQMSGIDISPVAANMAGVKVASATKLPYKNESFDAVMAISIIEHMDQKDGIKFVREARRVLKKDGYIFLVTPNFQTPIRWLSGKKWAGYADKTHIFFYSPLSLKRMLIEQGFSDVQLLFRLNTPIIEWPLPSFVHKFPDRIKRWINYLFATTPFGLFFRVSFWIGAVKV